MREGKRQSKGKRIEEQVAFSSHSYSSLVVSLSEAKKNIPFATSSTHLHKQRNNCISTFSTNKIRKKGLCFKGVTFSFP